MENNFCVYRHIRPDKDEVFYIGKGRSDTNRPYQKYSRNPHWVNVVNKNEGKYEVEVMMSDLTELESFEKEVEFIKLYGRRNIGTGTLVNLTDGGEGTVGRVATKEQKEKLSKNRKESLTEKELSRLQTLFLGRKHSIESRNKMSKKQKGKFVSEDTKNKIAIGNKGKVMSEEARRKLSKHHTGKTVSEEEKLRLRTLALGLKHTQDSKRKISESKFKKVICTETGVIYESIKDASEKLGIIYSTLRCNINTTNGLRNKTTLIYYEE